MSQIETIKQNLINAIEECAWVVEGGDAHDLIDAAEQAHAAMVEALSCIKYLECVRDRLSRGVDFQCATCKHLKEWIFVESDSQRSISGFKCRNPICEDENGKNSGWEQLEIK